MALENFSVEQGVRIYTENQDAIFVDLIQDTGVPGGDTGKEDAAGVGSIYFRRDTGDFYRKIASANAPADWERISSDQLDDIFLNSSYDATTNGTPADGQAAQVALGYVHANQTDLTSALGIAQGDVDMGDYTGSIIGTGVTQRVVNQQLESAIEAISGGQRYQALGVTAATRVGPVLVDNFFSSEWEVVVEDAADASNRQVYKITALHNGTGAADATVVDYNKGGLLKVGSNFNNDVSVTLSGTGVTQDFALEVTSTEPSGVNVYARRTDLP